MLSVLNEFVDRLAESATGENVRQQMVRFFSARGHPCLVYGYTSREQGGGYPSPEKFYSGAVQQGLGNFAITAAKHPIIQRVGSHTQPFYWGHASSRGRSSDTLQSRNALLVDCSWAREAGQGSCLVVPLHHPNSPPGLVSIFSELAPKAFNRSLETVGSTLCLAALAADERLRAIRNAEMAKDVGLSSRERECLEWLCKGLRNDGIAERMGITLPTVDMHLAKARKKLGAVTREQALVKALTLGLIYP
jgi:DNA-binding CsgD family transcriptional regulator